MPAAIASAPKRRRRDEEKAATKRAPSPTDSASSSSSGISDKQVLAATRTVRSTRATRLLALIREGLSAEDETHVSTAASPRRHVGRPLLLSRRPPVTAIDATTKRPRGTDDLAVTRSSSSSSSSSDEPAEGTDASEVMSATSSSGGASASTTSRKNVRRRPADLLQGEQQSDSSWSAGDSVDGDSTDSDFSEDEDMGRLEGDDDDSSNDGERAAARAMRQEARDIEARRVAKKVGGRKGHARVTTPSSTAALQGFTLDELRRRRRILSPVEQLDMMALAAARAETNRECLREREAQLTELAASVDGVDKGMTGRGSTRRKRAQRGMAAQLAAAAEADAGTVGNEGGAALAVPETNDRYVSNRWTLEKCGAAFVIIRGAPMPENATLAMRTR